MAFPPTLTLVSVHAAFDVPPGGGAGGTVTFNADRPLQGGADNSIVPPFSVTAVLDADGEFTAQLPATDDPQWSPSGWAYRVDLLVSGSVFSGTLQLAYGSATAELADLLQVSGAAQVGVTYIPFAQRSVAGGVAALDADGDVTDATGNKITGGGGGGGVTSVAGKTGTVTLLAADISNATTVGRAMMTAADEAAARTAIGAAAAGGGGGTARYVRHGYVTTGNVTPQNTGGGWAMLTGGPTFTVPASVGSEISFDWAGLMQTNSNTFYDPAVVVGGVAQRYASSGSGTPAVEGDPGLYPDVIFPRKVGPFTFMAQAGDISGGNVTIGFAVKSGGGGTLYAGTAFPLRWTLTSETPA